MPSDPSDSTVTFINGLDLCQAFYNEAVAPILREQFPGLKYAAALIGNGSEVLGFDTEMSADHHWGPRLLLFLKDDDVSAFQTQIKQILSEKLPRRFRGYPTSYTSPDEHDKGVQLLDFSDAEGPINHRVTVLSARTFIQNQLGFDLEHELTPADWLTLPQQKLLTVTAGRVFHDQIGLQQVRAKFEFYPHDVWLYLLASAWGRIEQEEHLMGRAGFVGDEIGSALIGARLVRDLMQLCFLMEKQYAPYPKWFGTAFRKLACAPSLEPIFQRILSADNWKQREKNLVTAYEYVANRHQCLGITEELPPTVSDFFDRPFLVISKGAYSKAISEKISDREIKRLASKPLIGSIDQFSDSTDLKQDPIWRNALRLLYV